MNPQLKILKEIIELLENYSESNENLSTLGFIKHILYNKKTEEREEQTPDEFLWQINQLYKHHKVLLKKILETHGISNVDDYYFLKTLFNHGSLAKSELIHLNVLEITSGTDIIKRLINMNLVVEADDEKDKRSKRVTLSEKGKEMVNLIKPDFELLTHFITSGLGDMQKEIQYQTLAGVTLGLDSIYGDIRKMESSDIKGFLEK